MLAVALALSPGLAAAESLDSVIEAAQELKRAAPAPSAPPLAEVIDTAQALKRQDAATRPRAGTLEAVLDRGRELKRKYTGEAPPPPPAPSLGRIVERAQDLKRQAAEAAEARDRETAALIKEVERGPTQEEINARKEAFVRDRLDPMLGERRTFLVNLDQHIRKHGILAFVAGLSEADRKASAELARITEDQRALMAAHPDLFTADDLRSSQVLTDLLKLLAQ
ncbi:hypothetical protein TSO221_24330 [Azospirillum sp. TSO22-1]|nr:hypothetical protein TSO221_24330 [Azospirillum sp. TSO22-1]